MSAIDDLTYGDHINSQKLEAHVLSTQIQYAAESPIESAIQIQLAVIMLPFPESLIKMVFDYLFQQKETIICRIQKKIMSQQTLMCQNVSILNDSITRIFTNNESACIPFKSIMISRHYLNDDCMLATFICELCGELISPFHSSISSFKGCQCKCR